MYGETKTYGKATLMQRISRALMSKEWFKYTTLRHPSDWDAVRL
jgi:hypothetical protein